MLPPATATVKKYPEAWARHGRPSRRLSCAGEPAGAKGAYGRLAGDVLAYTCMNLHYSCPT